MLLQCGTAYSHRISYIQCGRDILLLSFYLYPNFLKLFFFFEYLNHHLNMNLFKQQKKKNVDHMLHRNRLLFIVEIVIQIQSNAFFLYEFLFSLIYGKMLKKVHSLLVVYNISNDHGIIYSIRRAIGSTTIVKGKCHVVTINLKEIKSAVMQKRSVMG